MWTARLKETRILTLGLSQGELEIFVKPDAPPRPVNPGSPGPAPPGLPGGLRGRHRGGPGTPGIACDPIRMDPYTQKPMTFFYDPDGLPLELHE